MYTESAAGGDSLSLGHIRRCLRLPRLLLLRPRRLPFSPPLGAAAAAVRPCHYVQGIYHLRPSPSSCL